MFTLADLDAIVASRASVTDGSSWTATLLSKGVEKCAQKLGEEAVEAAIAAAAGKHEELRKEAADVLYHLLVLLRAAGVPLESVMSELQSRTARSGLAEKASRGG